jgi:hypothetical protein
MGTPIDDHLELVVLPALRDYWSAEAVLSNGSSVGHPVAVAKARQDAMRRARTAAIELHHLTDVALKSPDPRLPIFSSAEAVRAAVTASCVYLRGTEPSGDVALLRDVAEAFKHHRLDRKSARVVGADAVVACQSGFGQLAFGEGKFGGADQMVITQSDGSQRALTSVLQNVIDAWRTCLGFQLPPINDFS